MLIYFPNYATFNFEIPLKGEKNCFVRQYDKKIEKCTWTHSTNFLKFQTPKDDDFGNDCDFDYLDEREVTFDTIIISATEYTHHKLCITLWSKGKNVLYGNMNFLPISNLNPLLFKIGIELTEKQKKALQKMMFYYSKKWNFPLFQLE